jgi:glycosyltransferase involved in cell wall biosynthesis
LENSAEAQLSLELASKIVVLQPLAAEAVPETARRKVKVIFQCALHPPKSTRREEQSFQECVLSHLRHVKDPLRAAYAVRELPDSSRIQVKHAGGVLDEDLRRKVEAEQRTNARFQWLGPLPHEKALDLLARSSLLVLTSHLEGGANVLSEAIAASVAVVSSLVPGSVGILGKEYPGYFPVGDTAALRTQLQRAESDEGFYQELQQGIARLRPLVSPAVEREAWRALLNELT